MAIFLAAKCGSSQPITAHTERLVIPLEDDFCATMGIASTRERDRRASVARAGAQIVAKDPRYSKLSVEAVAPGHVLRIDRRIGVKVLPSVEHRQLGA